MEEIHPNIVLLAMNAHNTDSGWRGKSSREENSWTLFLHEVALLDTEMAEDHDNPFPYSQLSLFLFHLSLVRP